MQALYELADTDPTARRVWIEALRRLTPGEKIGLVFDMITFMHDVASRQIRREHPEYSEHDVLRELVARRYGRELAVRAYPRAGGAGP